MPRFELYLTALLCGRRSALSAERETPRGGGRAVVKAEVSCLIWAILDYLHRRAIDPRKYVSGPHARARAARRPDRLPLRPQQLGLHRRGEPALRPGLREELADEQLAFRIGHESVVHRRFGYIQNVFLRLFLSPEQGLRKAQEINDRFNRTKRVELVDLSEGKAALSRLTWHAGMEHSKDICLYNQGIYSAIAQAWGMQAGHGDRDGVRLRRGQVAANTGCAGNDVSQPLRVLQQVLHPPRRSSRKRCGSSRRTRSLLSQKYREVQDLTGRLRRKIRELETIHESGKAVVSLLDRRELLNVIMRLTTSSLGYDRGIILLHDEEEQCLVTAASSGGEIEMMKQFGGYPGPLNRTSNILVRSFNSGKPVLVDDVAQHGLNQRNLLLKAFAPTSFLIVPLISRGKVIGVLAADRASRHAPITEEDLDALAGFGNHVAVALEIRASIRASNRLPSTPSRPWPRPSRRKTPTPTVTPSASRTTRCGWPPMSVSRKTAPEPQTCLHDPRHRQDRHHGEDPAQAGAA